MIKVKFRPKNKELVRKSSCAPCVAEGRSRQARLAAERQALLPGRGQSPLWDQEHSTTWGRVPGFRHTADHTSQGQSARTRERNPIFPMGKLRPSGGQVVCPGAPLGSPRGTGPRAAQLALLPAQFLFLVLRSCDERGFSSHTSSERLGGAGPPTAASLRPPSPSVPWASRRKREAAWRTPPHLTGLLST